MHARLRLRGGRGPWWGERRAALARFALPACVRLSAPGTEPARAHSRASANALARLTNPASPRDRCPAPHGRPRPRGQELGGAAGPLRALFAAVLRPQRGRAAAARRAPKGPRTLENAKIPFASKGPPARRAGPAAPIRLCFSGGGWLGKAVRGGTKTTGNGSSGPSAPAPAPAARCHTPKNTVF